MSDFKEEAKGFAKALIVGAREKYAGCQTVNDFQYTEAQGVGQATLLLIQAYERGRREENEACAKIAHDESVEAGGSGEVEVVFYKIRSRMEKK